MTHLDTTEQIRRAGLDLGLSKVGFAAAEPFAEAGAALGTWLDAGHHGTMTYLAEPRSRADPRALLPSARSIVVVALAYGPLRALRRKGEAFQVGQIAAYARGEDYHRVLKDKLWALSRAIAELTDRPVETRVCVDTAPILEREAARRAGIGFTAKSAMCIAPGLGSTILLGCLLTDLPLTPDPPVDAGCGRCTACLDACPTGAFVGPRVVDARRCIAYLTIEHTGPIPPELRPAIGTRVFGCDVCQDVCPFNQGLGRTGAPELAPREALSIVDLVEWLGLGAARYRKLVRRSALRRTHRAQLARNAAVALGNLGDPAATPALEQALRGDRHPLVRGHAAWALGRLGGASARAALATAAREDTDGAVRAEARAALAELDHAAAR